MKTIERHWQQWAHKTQDEDNPETLATVGTQDTELKQFRDTSYNGYTRHRMKTIQRHWQQWAHKAQDDDNPETLATMGTQDTG
jgi:outer membrane phospholipase A